MWSFVLWTVIHFEIVSSKTAPNEEQGEYRSGRFSVAYHILLPVAGLTLFVLGKKHVFTKLMLQLDRNCVSVFCPSFSKREKLLKWAFNRLPSKWSSKSTATLSGGVADLWKDGSLLCTLLNTAIPGACPNPYRHWKQPPAHAQAIAYKYLGIIPIFTDEDLSGNLSPTLECRFITYLNDIQQAMDKISENSEADRPVTSKYVARGMGLFSGEQHKKAEFYVYSAEKENNNGNVMVQIKGPYGTYGQATITLHKNLLKAPKVNIISDADQAREFLRPAPKSAFKGNFSKYFKYHQKHIGESIVIDVVTEDDRAKLTYIPKHYGMYEINIISNGELLKGCPFNVHIFSNDSENTSASKGKSEKPRSHQKRKVISKTIDLIDEKIPLSVLKEKYQNKTSEPVVEAEKAPEKPKFNFIEVVEEITKNNEEFKDIFDVETTETCLTEELDEPSAQNNGDLSVVSSETIVQEADSTTSLEAEPSRPFEIEEADDKGCLMNFNVEIEIPVKEEEKKQESKVEIEKINTASIPENGRHSPHSEQDSKNQRDGSVQGGDTQEPREENLNITDEENSTSRSENDETLFNKEHNSKNYGRHSSHSGQDSKNQRDESVQGGDTEEQCEKKLIIPDEENSTSISENDETLFNREQYSKNYQNPILQSSDGGELCCSEQSLGIDQDPFPHIPDAANLTTDSRKEKDLTHIESHGNHKENELLHSVLDSLHNLEEGNITRISENGHDVPDSQHHLDDYQDLSLPSIEEEDNFASVSDDENNLTNGEQHSEKHSSSRPDMMCKVNQNNISNKQRTIADDNSKVNNPMFTDQSVVNGEDDGKKLNFQIGSKYMNNNINRIKIPEKFVENPKSIVINNLEHRYFTQKISNSERSETTVPTKIKNHTSTEYRKDTSADKEVFLGNMVGVTNKLRLNTTPSGFFRHQDPLTHISSTRYENISPICPDHIAPEVDFMQLSVVERRKIFAQNSKDSVTSSSKNSSFSETENTDGSRTGSRYEIEGLSVLNVLHTLKRSRNSIDESFSLSSTKSLPDISSESEGAYSDSIRERKNFWENVLRSSSTVSLTSTKRVTKKVADKFNEGERCRLTWRKPIETTPKPEEATIQKTSDLYKSADDILSMTKGLAHQNSKNYKSMGDSLNESEMLTIDERKKMLLKQNYEAEKQEREKLRSLKKKSVMLYDSRNINKISEAGKVDAKAETRFSVIGEKIRKYNSASNLPIKEENNNKISFSKSETSKPNNIETVQQKDLVVSHETPRKRARSQFKRAVKYFQKLEEKSQGKTKSNNPNKAKKFTLQITSRRERHRKKGGSLNLPKISDRFSVNNLYEDVIGNRKGSFKGTPNRTALVEALATFSRKENSMYDFSESEDDIKYEIFKNHIKSRKRRSIRSIFDVYY